MSSKSAEKQEADERAAAEAANGQPDAASEQETEEAHGEIEQLRQEVEGQLDEDGSEEARVALEALAHRARELDNVQDELQETKEQLMRTAASFRNYRNRAQRDQEQAAERARGDVLKHMLDVLDDFDRSLEAADQVEERDEPNYEAAHRSLKEGVELVYKKFVDELKQLGIQPIEAVGQPFDEQEHEAMMQQPAPEDVEPGTVLDEVRKGYRLGDRVLRHSRVIVAGEREEDADDA